MGSAVAFCLMVHKQVWDLEGMGSSIAHGVVQLEQRYLPQKILIQLVDQPLLQEEHFEKLVENILLGFTRWLGPTTAAILKHCSVANEHNVEIIRHHSCLWMTLASRVARISQVCSVVW